MASEFCQHEERGRRCVAYRDHVGKHDLQPAHSVSVRAIDRRESELEKLGFGEQIVQAIDEEVETSSTETEGKSSPETQSEAPESVPAQGSTASTTSSPTTQTPAEPAAGSA